METVGKSNTESWQGMPGKAGTEERSRVWSVQVKPAGLFGQCLSVSAKSPAYGHSFTRVKGMTLTSASDLV